MHLPECMIICYLFALVDGLYNSEHFENVIVFILHTIAIQDGCFATWVEKYHNNTDDQVYL